MGEPRTQTKKATNNSRVAMDRAKSQNNTESTHKKSVYDSLTKENTFVFSINAESRIGRPSMNKRLLIVIKDTKGEESAAKRVNEILSMRGLLSREYDTLTWQMDLDNRAFNEIKNGRGKDWYDDPYFGRPQYEEYLNS